MKKLIIFILLVLFISKFDLGNITNGLENLNTLIKNININDDTTKNIINYIKDPKDFLTDIIDKDFEKLHYDLNTLETEYYDKLLIEYNINKTELNELINNTDKDKEMVKKQYIIDKTKLSEMDYYQIFVFPFNKVDKPEIENDMSFTEFKDNYEQYLIESINYLENKLDD
ncbi:MAG: hypothetical protein K0Q49_279 [Haloplasmataceae bacterium]|nr:hypothetical protein [Haloplasmataceae bacterium]